MYRESLAHHLHLLREHPHSREVVEAVAGIITRLKTTPGAPPLDLTALARPLFPQAATGNISRLMDAVERLALGRHAPVLAQLDGLQSIESLRPHGPLMVGAMLLRGSEKLAAAPPGSAEAAQGSEVRHQVRSLFSEMRQRMPDDITLAIEAARMELSDLEPDERVSEEFLRGLGDLLSRARGDAFAASSIHLLEAEALKKRFGLLLAGAPDGPAPRPQALLSVLMQWRTALRRAIREVPEHREAYLALARTYREDAGFRSGPRKEAGTAHRSYFEADHARAAQVLRAAPGSTQVLATIASLMQRMKMPGEAISYYRDLLRSQPSEAVFLTVIGCFLAAAEPSANRSARDLDPAAHEEARRFLEEFERVELPRLRPEHELALGFPALKEIALAIIHQDEARSATEVDGKRLKRKAVESYRRAWQRYRAAGRAPPIDLLNNLAWLLGEEEETREEALGLIEEARARVAGADSPHADAVEDTRGWVLYQKGDLAAAAGVYAALVGRSPTPSYCLHYAKLLRDMRKYPEALAQLEAALSFREKFPEARDVRRLQAEVQAKLRGKFHGDIR